LYGNGRIKQVNLIYAHDNLRSIHYEIKEENVNKNVFLSFLENLYEKINNDFDLNEKLKRNKLYVVMDNARIHKGKEILKYFKEKNINLIFLPPYMPEFTPIELVFSIMKKAFFRKDYSNV